MQYGYFCKALCAGFPAVDCPNCSQTSLCGCAIAHSEDTATFLWWAFPTKETGVRDNHILGYKCCWTWIPRTVLEELPNQCRNKKTGDNTERERAQCATETVEERSERLRKLKEKDHAKHTTKTASERQATLQWKSTHEHERMANETSEEKKKTRLQRRWVAPVLTRRKRGRVASLTLDLFW